MSNAVDIIIPTWNNPEYLQGALNSLMGNRSSESLFHVYVINNGHKESCDWVKSPGVTVLQTGGENLGWEGGLKLGLEHSTAPFVCFFNDDAYIPASSRMWLNELMQAFRQDDVAAVGPSSNVVMGWQNIFAQTPYPRFSVSFLIGFCMLVRRAALDAVGGVDDSLPGGDDLDLSIRLRKAGYRLIADRCTFVYHHGFKTGERIHGTSDKTGGWNSYEFKEQTDLALIRKHGFRAWWECLQGIYAQPSGVPTGQDIEGDLIRARVNGETIIDLGVGSRKTIEHAIGVDMVKHGDFIDTLGTASVADVQADIEQPLPFTEASADTVIARHILEHVTDPISVIKQWARVLKPGGRMVIAVPDEGKIASIPMNIEHKHAWDMLAMKSLLETCGLRVIEQLDGQNQISFITVAEKKKLGRAFRTERMTYD